MKALTVFFVGKPASGKGTQAQLLAETTGWPIIGTSTGLRELVSEGGRVGEKLRETMDAGLLTPYWMAGYIFLKNIFILQKNQGAICDGALRSIEEGTIIIDALTWLERSFVMIHLQTPDEEIRSRIALRKDKENRADDHEHAVEKRMSAYYDRTDKVIEFYRSQGLIIDVNGVGAPEDIAREIRSIVAHA
jgi:adenylate kinase